ncbi:MAG: N-acetyltransferase [Planctomycetes bacterium]|nr:N-acetyltransferase [Planctomycetota bacterium]
MTGASLRVEPVTRSKSDLVRFWKAGLPPYEGDPHFVVPLLHDCIARWSPKSAFFRHAETQHFVAVRRNERGAEHDVGRIAATVDHLQDEVHGDRTGLFGWFETEDRRETAHALLDAAATWLRARGRDRVRGPLSYTTNGVSGLIVEDLRPGPPVVDMAYNPPWYAGHLEAWGLAKAKDLVAMWADMPATTDERLARITARVRERGRFVLRPVRTDDRGFKDDVEKVLEIYNGAWERNWGFVPLTPDEIREQAVAFRPILVPDLMLFAERDGRAVAFSLGLPDANQALAKIRGRLWPWSAVRLALALKKLNRGRVITLGILPEFRRTGLDATLIFESTERARRLGWTGAECSWVLDDNLPMIQAIRQVGGSVYRTYRVYEKTLSV